MIPERYDAGQFDDRYAARFQTQPLGGGWNVCDTADGTWRRIGYVGMTMCGLSWAGAMDAAKAIADHLNAMDEIDIGAARDEAGAIIAWAWAIETPEMFG